MKEGLGRYRGVHTLFPTSCLQIAAAPPWGPSSARQLSHPGAKRISQRPLPLKTRRGLGPSASSTPRPESVSFGTEREMAPSLGLPRSQKQAG